VLRTDSKVKFHEDARPDAMGLRETAIDGAQEFPKASFTEQIRAKLRIYQVRTQTFFLRICVNRMFALTILLLIVLNTTILGLDHYPETFFDNDMFNKINTFLTWAFFCEMMIKVIGLGLTNYVKDRVNVFDAFVVLITVAQNITEYVLYNGDVENNASTSTFRAIRLLRFFKIARTFKSFQIMVDKIGQSVSDIGSFSVLLFLFLFTFTLLGVELYANSVRVDSDGIVGPNSTLSPRPNFDTIMQSFICIFYIMIGDNWDTYAQPYILGTNQGAAWFFTAIFLIGKTILLNLFLAILLENFEEMDT
jgi:hypothetical protein